MDQEIYRKSLKYFEDAIENFSILGDLESRAEVLHSIGLIYKNQGKKPKALKQFDEALKVLDKIGASKSNLAGIIKKNADTLKSQLK